MMFHQPRICLFLLLASSLWITTAIAEETQRDLAQQVRSILSNRCFACHGPDADQRQGGFRLDDLQSMQAAADSGLRPIVPGDAEHSELLSRIASDDDDARMPPADFGARLEPGEVAAIREWILQGAKFPQHWSFVAPRRVELPDANRLRHAWEQLPSTSQLHIRSAANSISTSGECASEERMAKWLQHPVDRFVLQRQLEFGLSPSPPATRGEQLRRLSLDLTGLPATFEEVTRFEQDSAADAYERQVDRLLASPAYGEHWARKWLDLARYADSAGYADDPAREIWAYRDWVVDALNANQPVDQFTLEQIAGDLLPDSGLPQLIATAFHRNTLTNNEGGTNDEEFRSVAIVDRVNTTLAVWMGVTMACAQCHTHKYDPFTQEEYFQLYAIFNQTQDADRQDESPVLPIFTSSQIAQRKQWETRLESLTRELAQPTPQVLEGLAAWEATLVEPQWTSLGPESCSSQRDSDVRFDADHAIHVRPTANNIVTDIYQLALKSTAARPQKVTAIAIRTLPSADLPAGGAGTSGTDSQGGNFVVTGISATLRTDVAASKSPTKFVRVELPGDEKILSLAEVQVLSGESNIALSGQASQSSTAYSGDAARAVDGETSGDFSRNSTTHTNTEKDPWWEVDLGLPQTVQRVVLWNRSGAGLAERLAGAKLQLLGADRELLFESTLDVAPPESVSIAVEQRRPIRWLAAYADYAQSGFSAANVIDSDSASGWAVGGAVANSHLLTLVPEEPFEIDPAATLELTIEHKSTHRHHLLGSFRVECSDDASASQWCQLSPALIAILAKAPSERSPEEQRGLEIFYSQNIAAEHAPLRRELAQLQSQIAGLKPESGVPVMRELEEKSRRETFVQIRGNYKALGAKVQPGVPAVFHPLPTSARTPNRLDLAQWLVDRQNPLTARVWVNRIWESLFGIGIVRTSEEFGSQGDRPSHPELLDWLACELMDQGWDTKRLLRAIVTSETYRQTSRVTIEALEADKENLWLARGPRVRLSAEMVRDQALSIAGMLSGKMYGPPVRPPQPNLGLRAAFGSDTDWKTSDGEDRYRRGLYTTWRRSNPYPSMAAFDAPSREVCTLRRDSTNTPLQALVTLNDPGFVEAAQGLARRVVLAEGASEVSEPEQLQFAFRLCTSRSATPQELSVLQELLTAARRHFSEEPGAARSLATDPIGPLPDESRIVEVAAWTSVCNVLLNLDEVLMKR